MWAIITDRLADVPALIARADELGKRAHAPQTDAESAGEQAALAYRNGTLGHFAEMLDAQIQQNPQLVVNLPVLALAHLQAGNRIAGKAIFDQIARDDFAMLPRDMLWLGGTCVLAQVCALIGDEERAPVLYQSLVPHRERNVLIGMATCWGSCERFLGLLAATMHDHDLAVAHLETAIARNADSGIDGMFEMVRAELATVLEARDKPGDATHAKRLRAETLATAAPDVAATRLERLDP
jgi:hypothetical protein